MDNANFCTTLPIDFLVYKEPKKPDEHILVLDGLVRSKKNGRITNRSTGRSFVSKEYSTWHRDAVNQITQQMSQITGIPLNLVSIEVSFVFGTKRRTDLSNKFESIADLLVDVGILVDDCWQVMNPVMIRGSYEKGIERTTIRIGVL